MKLHACIQASSMFETSSEFFPSVAALQGTRSETEERTKKDEKDWSGDNLEQAIASARSDSPLA